jgi:hypothetical protein
LLEVKNVSQHYLTGSGDHGLAVLDNVSLTLRQIVVRVDPFTLDELLEQRAVETARATISTSSTHACWRNLA